MPFPDGLTSWFSGTTIRAYNADRLPPSLAKKQWLAMRTAAGSNVAVKEYVPVEWPYLTRVIHTSGKHSTLKPIFPCGNLKLGPDGSMVWFFRSNWYGSTGEEWSPMYMSRSTDMGKTWSKPENFADIGTLPRNQSGNFPTIQRFNLERQRLSPARSV